MRKRLTKDEIEDLLRSAELEPEYYPSEKEFAPYVAWFLSDTDVRTSDDGTQRIAEDTLRIFLCDTACCLETEARLIEVLTPVCDRLTISRTYIHTEQIHVSEFTVGLIGRI